MRSSSIAVRLPAGVEAAGQARHAVGELSGVLSEPRMEDLRLLVSELVTNSVRHAGMGSSGEILLEVRLTPSLVRVEVGDRGSGFRAPREPVPEADSGWGLYLVNEIASRWGSTRGRRKSTVWFELDL